MTQTLAVGTPLAAKYNMGGIRRKVMVPPPDTLLGAVVAYSARGKSSFLQSNPAAFIFNSDGSSTTNPDPQAYIWPALDTKGHPCEQAEPGSPGSYNDPNLGTVRAVQLTWDQMLEKKQGLIEWFKSGDPEAPRMAVMDTVGTTIRLVQDWVTRNAKKLNILNKDAADAEHFGQLHGPSAWDEVYTQLLNFALDIHAAGMGFLFAIHLADKLVRHAGKAEPEKELGFNITDNFWLRLFPWFEIVMMIDIDYVTREDIIPGRLLPGGKIGPPSKKVTNEKGRVLIVDSPDPSLSKFVKQRVSMPGKIALPPTGQWKVFEEAYVKSAKVSP